MTTSHSDFARLRPGWLVGYRETPEQPCLQAEVIANNPQDGHMIILVGEQKLPATLDLNNPAHLEQLGTPF